MKTAYSEKNTNQEPELSNAIEQQHLKHGAIFSNAMALGLAPEKARELLQIKDAKQLREQWDYRKLGLKIEEARNALRNASSSTSYHRAPEIDNSPYVHCPRVKEHLKQLAERNKQREKNLRLIANAAEALTLGEILQETNGYGYGYSCKIALMTGWLVIERIEHAVWSECKSRKWPVSRATWYKATHISATGDTLAYAEIDHRKGDWLEKVGLTLGLQTSERNATTMTGAMVPVSRNCKNNVEITEMRLFGTGFTLFCASLADTHYHAATARDAVMGLSRKIKAHRQNLLDDSEVITVQMAKRMGFCQEGIDLFCAHLGLVGVKSVTAGRIRAAIEDVDVSSWHRELVALGILPAASNP